MAEFQPINPDNIVNVQILLAQRGIQRVNMNSCCLLTSSTVVVNSADRTRIYTDPASVQTDFGSASAEFAHASVFFSQNPNPTDARGYLIIGFWRATDETVAATAGVLTGAERTAATVIPALQAIQDGSFNITIDGNAEQNITALDFRTDTTMAQVATRLSNAITGATVAFTNNRFIATSATTGTSSVVTLVSAGTAGTFIGETLGLSAGTGAVAAAGAAGTTLTAETKLQAVAAVNSVEPFKGFVFIDSETNAEYSALANWAQTNRILHYNVFSSDSNLDIDPTNPVWDAKLRSYKRARAFYKKDGDRKLATGAMARMHTILLNAAGSFITLNLKNIVGVTPDSISQDEFQRAQNVGIDVYGTIKDEQNLPVIVTSTANSKTDLEYGLIAYEDDLQTTVINVLQTTPTKVANNVSGHEEIKDAIKSVNERFILNGFLTAGLTWNGQIPPNINSQRFSDAIRDYGFIQWYDLSAQTQEDRVAGRAAPFYSAGKVSGAILSVDIIARLEE